jgi:cyanophycin synthetase
VTGTHGKNAVAKLVAHLIYLSGQHAGLACKDGIYLGRRQVQKTNAANWEGGRRLLLNRAVQAAVIENGAPVILGEGLPYDRCSVGIVTNIVPDEEDLSRWDVQPTGGEYYTTHRSIFRTQVDVVLPSGHAVLNAEDELVAEFAELCDGEVILFAVDPANPVLLAHLAAGKRGVTVVDKRVMLRRGNEEIRLSRLIDAPYIGKTGQPKQIANLLAGIAAGWALDLGQEVLTTGIKTFGLEQLDPAALLALRTKKSQPAKKPAASRK